MKDGKTSLIQMAQCTRPGTSISASSKESTCQDIKNRSLLSKLMTQMLSGGADLELKEEYGRSPLLLAVRWNNHAAVDFLLGAGADPDVIDFRRWTILHYAASTGDIELLQILARHGPTALTGLDREGKSRDGMTATEMAQTRDDVCSEWRVAFHELLLSMEQNKG
ncbi:ankyrin repeat-containing domain protein [Leptodontidium sp. 2 PMI_412]|nr:ankyrin repeat-containing domain protein [Leptodontidium sp. 2 PMI_412]